MRVVGLIRRGVEAPGGPGTPGKLRFQLEQYCRDRSHELLSVIGLDDPPESSRPEGGLYGAVLAALRAVPSPELVLIPGSRHLADSVETFVERVLEVERLGVTVRNTASPLLDPVEIAVRELPRGGSATGRDRRIREAIASKAARGEVLGRTPYGYRKGLDGLPEPYPAEAAIVRDIFDLYAGVNPGQSGPGLRRLAAELGRRGARTRSGRAWTPVSLAGLLTNRAYTGEYVRGAQRITQNHPAIIDGAVFRRAQELLSGRRPVRRPRTKPEYLLSGLIRCQACDRLLRGVAKERRWRRADGSMSDRVYRYYACPERSGADGPHSTVRADGLERAVLDDLKMKLAKVGVSTVLSVEGQPDGRVAASKRASAERQVRAAAVRVASGESDIVELTLARAELRKARSPTASKVQPGMTVGEVLDALRGSDPAAAAMSVRLLIGSVKLTAGGPEITLRTALRSR